MITNEERKGERETRLVAELLSYLELRPNANPQKQFPPEPDVCFAVADGGIVGVEVTALQLQDTETHRIHSEIASLLRTAQQEYNRGGYPPVAVRFYTSLRPGDGLTLTKQNRLTTARQLADYLAANCPEDRNEKVISEGSCRSALLSQLYLTEVFLNRADTAHGNWTICQSALTTMATVDEIRQTIAAKESRLVRYARKYREVWLLIHNGYGHEPVNVARYPPENLESAFVFTSGFGRVFLMSSSDGLHKLKTTLPG